MTIEPVPTRQEPNRASNVKRVAIPSDRIDVLAASRLHFGLLSFGNEGRNFGGAGVMIDHPRIELTIQRSNRFEVLGRMSSRIEQFAKTWASHQQCQTPPACKIALKTDVREHVGLGMGTQLGLSVAVGLNTLFGLPQPGPLELARSVNRGLRSAVGTYGFLFGGLIAERGKHREPLAPLDCRVDMPSSWRFVLIRPHQPAGLHGNDEQNAFRELPPVEPATQQRLATLLRAELIPAAVNEDFASFSKCLYQYGRLAGSCFASMQGGPYNGPVLSNLVDLIRQIGVEGVGQSSWGPTLFALVQDTSRGQDLIRELREQLPPDSVHFDVTSVNNRGVEVRPSTNAGAESTT